MASRDDILARVRTNQPAPVELPDIPLFETGRASIQEFAANLERMGGRLVEGPVDRSTLIRELHPDAKVIVSATPEVEGSRPLAQVLLPTQLDDVDVGVVRARFAVAETGSVFLTEEELGVNALGFMSQHLVVLLDPLEIISNLHRAYTNSAFDWARYAVLMSGPSATADIEGILIRGAQGIRSLTVVSLPRSRSV